MKANLSINGLTFTFAKQPKKPVTTKHIAVFANGEEREIKRVKNGKKISFRVTTPDGNTYETNLRDIKFFLEYDYPDVKFKKVAT